MAKIGRGLVGLAPSAALPPGVPFASSDERVSGRLQAEAPARPLGGRDRVDLPFALPAPDDVKSHVGR